MSPLQDVSTIIGSREQLAVLLQLYDYQLEHAGTTGWESLLWVVNQLWVTTPVFIWYILATWMEDSSLYLAWELRDKI